MRAASGRGDSRVTRAGMRHQWLAAELRDNLYGVRAMSPTEAWAVGNFGTIAAHHRRRQDVGARPRAARGMPLFAIDFADAQHGWAVGKSALVLRTEDGGKTWKTQKTPLSIEKHLFKVRAVDANTAWAVGDWGTIIATTDGGATWQDRSLGVTPVKTERGRPAGPRRPSPTTSSCTTSRSRTQARLHRRRVRDAAGDERRRRDLGPAARRPPRRRSSASTSSTPERGWVVGIDGLVLRTEDGGAHLGRCSTASPRRPASRRSASARRSRIPACTPCVSRATRRRRGRHRHGADVERRRAHLDRVASCRTRSGSSGCAT